MPVQPVPLVEQPPRQTADTTIIYLIKEGDHYCQQSHLEYITKSTISFEATFNKSASYQTKDPEKQGDVNKLYGFSDCKDSHQTNSARFGWNWQDNALHIYAYHYRSGELLFQSIGTAQLDRMYRYQISIEGNQYKFRFDGKEVSVDRGCSDTTQFSRYKLYPYFGGEELAPHDVTIAIRELY
ncbi:hypothetical protein [Spirosoma agri]|uniref:Alginate lyase 2 domain-containing protein n=1 Tax=Spirosoma agri TaxID=1987381 RepID=A0A6M0ID91_9BACT|nr:hypothetical protein [Spirosoma agri]NEU66128.1 hypothetical protein [Spirosoma agri]